jgi:hypothetical protein
MSVMSKTSKVHVIRRKSYFLVIPLVLTLVFFLAACTGTTSGSGSNPAPSPTSVKGYGTSHGCPSNAVVSPAPPAANVTVHLAQSHTTVNAQTGNIVEFDLPFGQHWSGPTGSVGSLQLQSPPGYANTATKMCVWRFSVQGTGTTLVNFYGQAICTKGQFCPQYVMNAQFEVASK